MTQVKGDELIPAMLYLATTSSPQIPWKWISDTRGDPRFRMTRRERVDLLLRAVNGDTVPSSEWIRLCGAPLDADGQSSFRLWNEPRATLRAALEGIVRSPDSAPLEILKNAAEIIDSRVMRIPEVDDKGRLHERVIAHSIGAGLVDALKALVETDTLRPLLRQCAFSECGLFAIGTPPRDRGRPRAYFCRGTDHGKRYRRAQQREAKAAERKGITVEEFRRRSKTRST